ncbi:survival protein sura precursor (peptidyl-prolyl cis-trans isomerase sura) [Fulvimarina pelagi HTCC2506]|uniref:Survival protein sura (Peptidyl-prolyl cis-trans isomerase sura) n=2 Tax=Fulvimarina pelagi TaxID=217511 RepID=Q0G6M7_9HYPH|nr:survival protein sura precursor (peptidyl-prolyl cis-trans isomerase sura) [Fulvimarina pelagi HTCC2506]
MRGTMMAMLGLGGPTLLGLAPTTAHAASSVAAVVNGMPVTTYQIRQRAAFLKLRRVGGNTTQKATDELIDEALKRQEIQRQGVNIPDEEVNAAYLNFAKGNNLSEAQLAEVLGSAGFSPQAFKDYIRVQMGWGQAASRRIQREERLTEQDAVQRMLAQGGEKPSTTEYTLQQVIFVIPNGQRGAMLANRKREAQAMRQRFQSCDSTLAFAQGLRDVTVRDLGRVAQPELPSLWKEDVMQTSPGRATPTKETDRGVEFIGVCNARQISDDRAAQMVFQARDMESLNGDGSGADAALLKKLRDEAQIVRR